MQRAKRINPTKLTADESKQLAALLQTNKNQVYFPKDTIIPGSDTGLTHSLVYRPSKRTGESRYGVIDNEAELGSGAFGSIQNILATIAINQSGECVTKTNKKRVLKTINTKKIKSIQAETMAMEKASHLHGKKTIIDPQNGCAFIVYRHANGEDIFKLSSNTTTTATERLLIAYHLTCALKEQVHDKNIIHGDIKLDNVIVDKTKNFSIKIIDFGLSRAADHQINEKRLYGTLPYLAPEVYFKHNYAKANDIYSLGVTLIEILDDIDICEKTFQEHYPYINKTHQEACENFYLYNTDFETNIREKLGHFVKSLLTQDPEDRPTAEQAYNTLRTIVFLHLSQSPDDNANNNLQAKNAALHFIDVKKQTNRTKANYADKVYEHAQEALSRFVDTPEAMKVFCEFAQLTIKKPHNKYSVLNLNKKILAGRMRQPYLSDVSMFTGKNTSRRRQQKDLKYSGTVTRRQDVTQSH